MTKRIPEETAAGRGVSPSEAAGLRGAKARRRRRLAGKSRDGRGRPGDKQGDAKRLRSLRRETNAGPQARRAGSPSCEARPPGLAKPAGRQAVAGKVWLLEGAGSTPERRQTEGLPSNVRGDRPD